MAGSKNYCWPKQINSKNKNEETDQASSPTQEKAQDIDQRRRSFKRQLHCSSPRPKLQGLLSSSKSWMEYSPLPIISQTRSSPPLESRRVGSQPSLERTEGRWYTSPRKRRRTSSPPRHSINRQDFLFVLLQKEARRPSSRNGGSSRLGPGRIRRLR